MIPDELVKLIQQQPGETQRIDTSLATDALNALGIRLDSELAEFFINHTITSFSSRSSDEALCDIAAPDNEIADGTHFIHAVWELPENYICLTNIQGEGCYLYDKNSGEVIDFSLADRDEFMAGIRQMKWDSFYEFLNWYLT